MERNRSVILTLLILTFYVLVEVQWAQASVTTSSCISGEILDGSSGFFSSPNFPNIYPQYINCTWNITVLSGYIIKINFLHFQLGYSRCHISSGGAQLTITNVASSGGTLDGNYLPSPVYSVGNSIQVTFMSRYKQRSGFNASYTAITSESLCPNLMTLNDTSGVITSPYYPREYGNNHTCSWHITASKGNYIVLLIEYMNIKKCGAACTCDYLEIQNGLSSDGVSSARRCGDHLSNVIYHVYSDSLKVQFVSNRGGWRYYGFMATYTQVNYSSIPATCISGEFLNGSSGSFSSPNFPNNYPQYSRCTWNITVPSGYIIKISFLHFQLGWQRDKAQLTITNVASSGGTLYGLRWYYPHDPVYSVGNSIQVTFVSRANQFSGFNASYTAITYESLCPNLMTLNDTSGVITSPYYPRDYGNNHTCSWQITASKGNYIVLVIENMEIQRCGAACTCDYLEIQNGFSSDGVSSARRCGYLDNVIYHVFHDSLKLLFVSDSGGRWSRGFKATYTQVNYTSIPATCISGEFLNGSSGFFSSPNFPNNYPPYSRCTWNITVPSGYIIKVGFLHFQMDSISRGGAQLSITNVASSGGTLDGYGYPPNPVYSVGNSIQVTFISLSNQYSLGFNASYTAITYESLCPNLMILNDTSGTITSPYYPREYPSWEKCSWEITIRKGNYIVLLIEYMNIQQCGAACTCDYLEIQNGLSSDGVSSARRCGNHENVIYHAYNDSLKVLFVSNRGGRWYRGFKATYTQVNYTSTIPGTIPANLPTFSLLSLTETEAVFQFVDRKTLSSGNTVRYFQIIVIPLKKGTGSGSHPEIIKRKYEDQEEGEPYITAEFLKDESRATFTVGDGKYYSQFDLIEAVTKYLNGKLESNTQYAAFQRSFDEDGGYEDEGIVQFTTKATGFPTNTVVSIVVVLLFLPILAGLFIVWRRIHRHSENEMKTSLMNLQHSSTQGWMEMSANINTSMD